MSISPLSRKALKELRRLSKQQIEVLGIFVKHPWFTFREAAQHTDMELMSVRSRGHELQALGLLEQCGEVECEWTGRTVAVLKPSSEGLRVWRGEHGERASSPVNIHGTATGRYSGTVPAFA